MTALTHIYILKNILLYQSRRHLEKPINSPKMIKLRKDMRTDRSIRKLPPILYFTTTNSRTYHQSDCHELGTGKLLEFDSAEEALNQVYTL